MATEAPDQADGTSEEEVADELSESEQFELNPCPDEILDLTLNKFQDWGLSVRSINMLSQKNINCVRDALDHDRKWFQDVVSNFGGKSVNDLFRVLEHVFVFREGRGPDGQSGFFPGFRRSDYISPMKDNKLLAQRFAAARKEYLARVMGNGKK